jgi:hypothetical protein
MIKHYVEAVVNYGEFAAFTEATERYQKLSVELGLEPYTLWANQSSGRMNEVVFEATFDSAEALAKRDAADNEHPELLQALGDVIRHCAPASIVDRRLEPI